MKVPKTPEELERRIVEHPVEMYFRLKIGLLEEINENGEDMMEALEMIGESCLYLAMCILIAIAHIAEIIFYPIAKLVRFMRIRRRIMRNPGCLRFGAPEQKTTKK